MLHTPLLDVVISDGPAVHAPRLALEIRPQSAVLRHCRQVIEVSNVVDRWQMPKPGQSEL